MDTLYLTPATWDLTLDADANIALATKPYALAQDAASAIKTFQGECYYNTAIGVPYWGAILGQSPPLNLVRERFVQAAMTVPEVTAAKVYFSDIKNRTLSGQVQITDKTGNLTMIGF